MQIDTRCLTRTWNAPHTPGIEMQVILHIDNCKCPTVLKSTIGEVQEAIPALLWCPQCNKRHIDGPEFTKVHHTHACQFCGMVWRPAILSTVGVEFLPGFKNEVIANAYRATVSDNNVWHYFYPYGNTYGAHPQKECHKGCSLFIPE